MDSSVIVESLEGTLSPSQDVRKQSELKLAIFENEPNFLNLLLGLSIDVQSSKQTRASSSIYFKNKVIQNWMHLDTSKNRNNKILVISPDEKKSIRENLVNSILISCNDQQIRQQLTTALYHILVIEEWPELCDLALSLVREQKQQDHVYTGLLLIYEITKSKRWSLNEDRKLLNEVVEKSFPVLTAIAEPLISSFTGNNGEINSNNNNTNSNIYSEMLYLLLKIFKYSTFLELSPYFINNLNNLSKWVQFHLAIIDSNNLQELNSLDEIERNNNKKAKCLKWSFANLHRLQAKFGGGMSTTIKDSEFTKIFSSHFVPEILNIYWQAIAEWSQGKRLYTESCLYHLISFIDQCCGIDESWQLIQPKFDGILEHVLFKSLCATNETIELFEDDPEEYFRRFFDMNKDFKTSDVASINLLFSLCFKRFPVIINSVLNLLNNVFTKRSASMDDVEIAKEVEGALRILSTISFKIDKKSSPVSNQVDQLINSFIVPELSPQNRFKFLSTRACDTIARFTYQYKDMNVLLSVYQGCLTCFQNQDCMPLQVCAVDALSNLITEPNVKEAISEHITSIMEKLLYLSDNHEFDIINDIMDEFVDQFALQLEPFAVQIASNLNAQFIKIATELLENHNLTDDINKEYQAIGLLSTMTTMILSMTSSKDITSKLLQQFAPSIEIVMDNTMINFINEVMEIVESCNVTLKQIIDPTMWDIFKMTLNALDISGVEFCDVLPFLESCINYGFKGKSINDEAVQLLIVHTLKILNNCFSGVSDLSVIEFCYDILYKVILTVDDVNRILPEILKSTNGTFNELGGVDADLQEDCTKTYLKVGLCSIYRFPEDTFKVLGDEESSKLMELWFNNSDSTLKTFFDNKLQIMALINLLKVHYSGNTLPPTISQSIPTVRQKVIKLIENLPQLLSKQQELMKNTITNKAQKDRGIEDFESEQDYINFQNEEFLEYDEAEELDLLKDVLLDNVNVYTEFVDNFLKVGDVYNKFMEGINDQESISVINDCITLVGGNK